MSVGQPTTMGDKDGDCGIQVCVRNPRTQGEGGDKHTTYLIDLQSGSDVFSLRQSQVRRRYSEFVWLRDELSHHFPELIPPELPAKTWFTSRFDPSVIEDRKAGLEAFLKRVLSVTLYQSYSTLHLFLQTQLCPEDISQCVLGLTDTSPSHLILQQGQTTDPAVLEDEQRIKLLTEDGPVATAQPINRLSKTLASVSCVDIAGSPYLSESPSFCPKDVQEGSVSGLSECNESSSSTEDSGLHMRNGSAGVND